MRARILLLLCVLITSMVAVQAAPFFEDDFETGDLSKTGNGFSWTSTNTMSGDVVEVNTDQSYAGANALEFSFGSGGLGDDGWAEQRFAYPQTNREIWVEYYVYIPANYVHRDQSSYASDPSEHHKFYSLWGVGYGGTGRPKTVLELWRVDDDTSEFRFVQNFAGQAGSQQWGSLVTGISNSGPLYKGQWHRIRVYQDTGTQGNNDAKFTFWVDNQVIFNFSGINNNGNNNFYWDGGYLMGYTNGGFNAQTDFAIDDFKIHSTDPQWGAASNSSSQPPGQPGSPSFSMNGNDVDVTWSAGSGATSYRYTSGASNGSWPGQNGNLTGTSISLSGPAPSDGIWFCVWSQNSAGESASNSCNSYTVPGCQNGAVQSCGSNVGACQEGSQFCSGGVWGACIGGITPVVEVCSDSLDNDCDGTVNEGCSSGLPGDYNTDGVINFQDLVNILSKLGRNGMFGDPADADGDGDVDLFDLVLVARSWQRPVPASISVGQVSGQLQVQINATCPGASGWCQVRRVAPGPHAMIGESSNNNPSFIDSNVQAGTQYTYNVRYWDASWGAESLHAESSITVQAISQPDTTPPVISNPQPSGQQPNGTSQVAMTLDTDETAECRYHTSDANFASMTNTFATTNAQAHAQTITGLSDGDSRTYYVRCEDTAGNSNTASTTISFNIATPPIVSNITLLQNLPGGWTIVADEPFSDPQPLWDDAEYSACMQRYNDHNRCNVQNEPYNANWEAVLYYGPERFLLTADPTAPHSPNDVLETEYGVGREWPGYHMWSQGTGHERYYVSFVVKWDAHFQHNTASEKLLNFNLGAAVPDYFLFQFNDLNEAIPFIVQDPNNYTGHFPNEQDSLRANLFPYGSVPLRPGRPSTPPLVGEWMEYELLFDTTTGMVKWWRNGVPHAHYTGRTFGTLNSLQLVNTWGGGGHMNTPGSRYTDHITIAVGPNGVDTSKPAVTITAPTNGQPLASGTTSTTLTVTTNEDSECRYATSDGFFNDMKDRLSGAGSTTHTATLSGLTDGSSYTYYVRCEDMYLNQNSVSQTVTFDVATGAPSNQFLANEPSGMTVISDIDFSSASDLSVNGQHGTTAGFTDNTAPHSPSEVARFVYPTTAPAAGFFTGKRNNDLPSGTQRVYVAYNWKFSDPYTLHISGQKSLYLYLTQQQTIGSMVLGHQPFGSDLDTGTFVMLGQAQSSGTPGNLYGNTGQGPNFVRGQWYHTEMLVVMNSAPGVSDGVFHVWVDGVMTHNFTNVVYADAGDPLEWRRANLDPYYGGHWPGHTITQDSYKYVDHMYVSSSTSRGVP